MSRIARAASCAYCAAVYSPAGSTMSIRWCGIPRRLARAILSVPMSNPRYTAVESQLTISPRYRSASAKASALFPVAVGPRIATTVGSGTDANQEVQGEDDDDEDALSGWLFVVEKRDGEKRLVHRVLGRQRHGRIGRHERAVRRVVEGVDLARLNDDEVGDVTIFLVHVERDDHVSLQHHRRVGDEPV